MATSYSENGSRLKPLFGINIKPNANEAAQAFELAKKGDDLGVDLISIQDYSYNGSFFDT
jgi:hypothetical protein